MRGKESLDFFIAALSVGASSPLASSGKGLAPKAGKSVLVGARPGTLYVWRAESLSL